VSARVIPENLSPQAADTFNRGALGNAMNIERIRQVLSYDHKSGEIVWRVDIGGRNGRKFPAGSVAGCVCKKHGYRLIRVDGVLYRAHRLAWAMFYDEQPPELIDHRNTVKTDNRISNLREADAAGNAANKNPYQPCVTGFKGVFVDKRNGKFMAQGRQGKRAVYLGKFDQARDAAEAYNLWAVDAFGEFARLNTWQK
jgi:hypothetical protein